MLHLIDPDGPMVGPCATAMLGDLAGASAARRIDLMALIVGGSDAERRAQSLGINTTDRLGACGGPRWLAGGSLRRYLAAVGPVDLLHCWSLTTLGMTTLAAPGLPRLLTLTSEPIDREQGRWLRVLIDSARAPLTILTASSSIKRAWAHAGIEPSFMHVLRPGLDLTRLHAASREALRSDWGVRSSATTVVLVPAQHGQTVDACRAAAILACALLSGMNVMVVAPADAARRSAARMLAPCGGAPDRLVFDARLDRPWDVLPGCDIVLTLGDDTASASTDARMTAETPTPVRRAMAAARTLLGESPRIRPGQVLGVMPMLWAAAAGKPVIAEAGYAVSEVVENGKTALVVKPGDNGAIVERLRELIGDPHKAWSLRDAARSEAYSFFSCSRFAENLITVYEQILGGRGIEVPAMPLTGGLAFAGRQ